MSAFDPETANLDDPGVKLAIRGGRAGGFPGSTPGGGGLGGAFGGGGGGLLGGVSGAGGAGDPGAMRALLRKRLLAARGASYQSTPTPKAAAPPSATSSLGTFPRPGGGSAFDRFGDPFGRGSKPPMPGSGTGVGGGLPEPISTAGGAPGQNPDWGLNPNGLPKDVNFGSGMLGSLNEILRAFMGSGAFGTNPNTAIMAGVRGNALADAQAQSDRARLLAQSLGMDPASAASYAMQADLKGQGGVSKALSDASLEGLTTQRDFGQSLLKGLLGIQGTQNQYKPGKSGLDVLQQLTEIAKGLYP